MLIGFIDYCLDEWHANNYPAWLKEADPDCEVAYAYAVTDHPNGGMTTDEWCEKNGVTRCLTMEELVEKSDAIVVLSPDNCELHEALCQVPLRSGKPVYIDKTFSPNLAMGKRIFDIAAKHGTPCYSTSALRFAEEYKVPTEEITAITSIGGSVPEIYIIHQLEPVMMLMKEQAKRVMTLKTDSFYSYIIEFNSGRVVTVNQFEKGIPFSLNIAYKNGGAVIANAQSDFFKVFIANLAHFFKTKEVPVTPEETLPIMAVREAALKGLSLPGQWIPVEQL